MIFICCSRRDVLRRHLSLTEYILRIRLLTYAVSDCQPPPPPKLLEIDHKPRLSKTQPWPSLDRVLEFPVRAKSHHEYDPDPSTGDVMRLIPKDENNTTDVSKEFPTSLHRTQYHEAQSTRLQNQLRNWSQQCALNNLPAVRCSAHSNFTTY